MFAPSEYTFELPPELIAQEPAAERDASRLLHVRDDGSLADQQFADIVGLLPHDSVLVANDTRVIPARVLGQKESGGRVELLLLEPDPDTASPPGTSAWRCLARARGPLRAGQRIVIDASLSLELLAERAEDGTVAVAIPGDPYALLDRIGQMPLPRYIQRDEPREPDRERYQTMFARVPGAVAAPTAGLHMTPAIAERLAARRITIATVTLHVGYGTFEPIRVDDLRAHRMHRERYVIPEATAQLVTSGREIIALGTTALRALEASRGVAGAGTTDLFIYPGSEHGSSSSITSSPLIFISPNRTLLVLVCAFSGVDRVLAAYRHAVAARYRFFSYGDAMLLHRA